MQTVIDCHSDVMIDVIKRRRAGERGVLARVHLPAYVEGGVVAAVCTVGGDIDSLCPLGMDEPYRSALAMLDALHADIAESDGAFEIAGSPADVEACIERGAFAIVPAIEGAMPFEGDLGKIEDLHERGVRIVGLTWNSRNELAVGLNSGDGGLTPLGERAVALMNDLGILIDLAHATPETFWDVARVTRAPLYNSHSNAKAVWDNERNLDDAQLEAIGGSGGAVGVTFCPTFVAAHPVTLDDVLLQLDVLLERAGADSVIVGADFADYFVEEMRAEIAKHPNLYDLEMLEYPRGIETVRSMQNLVAAMTERGLGERTIENVTGRTFLRVLEQTQTPAARSLSS
jgi:membrane dipeptidase